MSEQTEDRRPGTSAASRRQFLATGGLAVAAAATADWRSRRAFAQTNARIRGANERINLGFIGLGGMGGGHFGRFRDMANDARWNLGITAVCDVWSARMNRAAEVSGAKPYLAHEDLVADPDVDAVLIASPEHWHHRQSIDAMRAGKDVYLEKPMTRYVEEAVEVAHVAQETGRVLQVGAQRCSRPIYRRMHELVPNIGQPVWGQTSYCRNSAGGEWNYGIDGNLKPEDIDWDRWVGPSDVHGGSEAFNPDHYFRWRKYWPYSSGIGGDLLPHVLYPLLIVLGEQQPVSVSAQGGIYVHHDRDVPDTFHFLADYPGNYTLFVAGSTANEQGVNTMIRGHEATMYTDENNSFDIRPERPYAEEMEPIHEEGMGVADDQQLHRENWIECIRSRETPNCGPELALAGMITVGLAEDSYRGKATMLWDPETRARAEG